MNLLFGCRLRNCSQKGERDVVLAAMAKSTGGSSRNGKVHERKIVLKGERDAVVTAAVVTAVAKSTKGKLFSKRRT